MSFWQNLVQSYDQNADALKAGYPLSATSISNNNEWIAVIIINGEGEFQEAYKIEKVKWDKKTRKAIFPYLAINVPVREKSAGRTSDAKKEPHPVFEQYAYMIDGGEQFDRYFAGLTAFKNSAFGTKQVQAIWAYISKRSVAVDLKELGAKAKTYILFEVQITGTSQSKVWEDSSFFDAWNSYYLSTKKDKALDSIIGLQLPLAAFHPKKISNASANAKLVSDNDTANFTFRGRFENSAQAVSIGYEASQKAHQFLRYLVNEQGITCGEQVILSFTVGSIKSTVPSPLNGTKSIWDFLENNSIQTESDKQIILRVETGFDYADALKSAVSGFKYSRALEQHALTVIAVLDAPISGRMSVTFYRELDRNEHLEKVSRWHNACKWHQQFWSKDKQAFIPYVGAPSVDRIIEAVYGKPRSHNDASYNKIKKSARERLLRCIFDDAFLPFDYVVSAIRRASNPLAVTRNDKFDRNGFDQLVSTACALVRKDFKQRKKEDYTLSLEPTRTDRDYLYGRLLGAADKLEEYALRKKGNDRMVTAAIRHMQTFSQRPFRTWQTIHACLNPYIQTVKGSFAFNEIQSVMQLFNSGDYEKDSPLDGSYLIGYYHERTHIDDLAVAAKAIKTSTPDNQTENIHE